MFLFFRNPDDDFGAMLEGYRSGVITENGCRKRSERILGLKASLGLHTTPREALVPVRRRSPWLAATASRRRCRDRRQDRDLDQRHAEQSPACTPRRTGESVSTGSPGADFTGTDPLAATCNMAREELERAGFEVLPFKTAQQRIAEGETGVAFHTVLRDEATADYAEKYDAAIVFANVGGFAQEATVRIHWSTPMAAEIPWYVTEVPTIFVSLSLPNHLIDVPMVKTVIHAHARVAK